MSETGRIMQQLIELRKAQNLKQVEAAPLSGYSVQRFRQIERSIAPSFDACAAYARGIGYRLDVFIVPVEAEPAIEEKRQELLELKKEIAEAQAECSRLKERQRTLKAHLENTRKFLQRGIA